MRVTQEMKEIGARIITRELGAQFIPDWLDAEEISERVFVSMLVACPQEFELQPLPENLPDGKPALEPE